MVEMTGNKKTNEDKPYHPQKQLFDLTIKYAIGSDMIVYDVAEVRYENLVLRYRRSQDPPVTVNGVTGIVVTTGETS